ncbi:hypothetical protein [Haliangium sp.]|uniref:hypothetical protein n=1 Tax=Haliangium sp. TaxID=2663208 RepID=UPI003D0A7371
MASSLPEAAKHKFAALGGGQPENFTSFLALKLFGEAAASLVTYARDRRLASAPRYHFFADPDAIAADIDCTGVALVGLYRAGALSDLALRQGADELLASAAGESLPAPRNRSHGKDNGPLVEGVLKVYWDDDVQPDAPRRGRKHDPACVANALHAVLMAARDAGLCPDGQVCGHERRADGSELRWVRDRRWIVQQNLTYLLDCLDRSQFLGGTRYYPSPDALLCFASMLVRDFPTTAACLRGPLLEALSTRWRAAPSRGEDPGNPCAAINLAMRIIAAQNLEVRESAVHREKAILARMQKPSGAWPAAALFQLGSMRCYFGSEAMTTVFALRALLGPYCFAEGDD